jgi:hypothetical protein
MDHYLNIPVPIKMLFYALPYWAVFLCIIFFFAGLTLFLFWLIPRLSKHKEESDRYQRAIATFIGVVGAFYGILFGLVNINLWQGFHKAQDIVSREATDMSVILTNSAVFPPDIREKIRLAVGDYVLAVRNDEWEKMGHEQSSPKAWQAMAKFFPLLQSYQPKTTLENIYYAQVLSHLNDAVDARRERVDTLQSGIPPPLYRMLVLGSFLLVFFLCLMTSKIKERRALLSMTILVNILVAFNLYLVVDLGNPFAGRISIKNTPFTEGTLAQFK